MKTNLCGLIAGSAFGFVIAWAQLTDPAVIRRMLLLQEFDVFLLMGSAIAVASVGCRVLRSMHVTSLISREPVRWTAAPPTTRHVVGSALFGVGWSVAGTCPGPVAAMIGQGRLGGLVVAAGILCGVAIHRVTHRVSPTAVRVPETSIGL